MHAEGSNGSVTLENNRIVIKRKGLANILTQGFQGDKAIPLKSITAIQLRAAGSWMAGCIQFSIHGGQEFRGGMLEATKDENAVLFERRQQPAFEQLKQEVERLMARADTSSTCQSDSVDELERLASLVDRGFLTKKEFDDRKRAILEA